MNVICFFLRKKSVLELFHLGHLTEMCVKNKINHLNAPPKPCRAPKPKGEKKSVSVSRLSNMLFFSNKLSERSKKAAKGLLEPKNWANVARGSPWNWYVKLLVVGPPPFDAPAETEKPKNIYLQLIPQESTQ